MMDSLEMLTAREQLMEDIDAIVDEFTFDLPIEDIHERSELAEELTSVLCDAVCKNFSVKWRQRQQLIRFKLQNQMDLRRF